MILNRYKFLDQLEESFIRNIFSRISAGLFPTKKKSKVSFLDKFSEEIETYYLQSDSNIMTNS